MNDTKLADELEQAWIFNEILDSYDDDIFAAQAEAIFEPWTDLIPAPTVKDVIAMLTPTTLMPIVKEDEDGQGE